MTTLHYMPKTTNTETKLSRLLESQGRKRLWVARELLIDHTTVSRWCSGERVIPPARITELAALLGVHEAEIVEDEQRIGVA